MRPTVTTSEGSLVGTGLTIRRGGRSILDDVSLQAARGELLAVTGPSGSGKSTLLSLLAGILRPDSGVVSLPDGATTSLVLQSHGLVAVLTTVENVELALQLRGVPGPEIERRAMLALERVGLTGTADRLVEELSGGQQQRVGVARALVVRPDVLLADEPTAELDAVSRDLVLGVLREEAERGAVVVLATHDPEAASSADRDVVLADGRVVER